MAGLGLLPFVRGLTAWSHGWVLIGDNANIAIRSQDVGTHDTPLIGMPSGLGQFAPGFRTAHPGPLVFWVIGPWVRAFGHNTLPVLLGTATVGAASSVAILWCGRRLAGRIGLLAAAAVLVTLIVFTSFEMIQPLNPVMAFLPALAALLAAAGLVHGDRACLPVLVAAGSFAFQADSVYVPLIATASAVAVAHMWRAQRSNPPSWSGHAIKAALAIFAVSWIGPLIDVALRRGGNVAATMRAVGQADLHPQGLSPALSTLGGVATPLWPLVVLPGQPLSIFTVWPLAIGGVAFALAVMRIARHEDRALMRSWAWICGPSLMAVVVTVASTPTSAGRQTLYLFPVVIAGGLFWFGLLTLAGRTLSRSDRRPPVWACATAVFVASALIGARVVLDGSFRTPGSAAVGALTAQVRRHVTARPLLLLRAGGPNSQSVLRGVGYYLQDDGFAPFYPDDQVGYVGTSRGLPQRSQRYDRLLITGRLRSRVPPDWRRVARWEPSVVGPREARRLRKEVASSIRQSDIAFTHQAGESQIGQVVARGQDFDARDLLYDDRFNALGRSFLRDPSLLRKLPDDTLAALVEEGIIQDGGLDDQLKSRFRDATAEDYLEIWLVPTEK